MLPDLRLVAAPEFVPAFRIMGEPLPQFGAGRDLFHPFIDSRIRLLYSARPKPVDQDSGAVIGGGRLIGSLEPDVVGSDLLAHRHCSGSIKSASINALPWSLAPFAPLATGGCQGGWVKRGSRHFNQSTTI